MCLGSGLRGGSAESAASHGNGITLRLLSGGRPGHPQQHGPHPASAAAALTPSSSVSRVSGGSSVSRLSGNSSAVASPHQHQQYGLPRHNSGGRGADTSGQSMQQIVALLEQMAADDRAAEGRPWRSMDLPAAANRPVPAAQRRGGVGNPVSLDLGRTPVRGSAVPAAASPRPPVAPLQSSPDMLPFSSVLQGRMLPPVRSSFAMAPPRRS